MTRALLTIDVLIVTRSADLLASCTGHLEGQTVPHRVFVGDNSEPGGAIARSWDGGKQVEVVSMGGNAGFGRAVNRIAAHGAGDVIVLLNDDVNVEPDFLERIVEPFGDRHVGMVAGMTLQPTEAAPIDTLGIRADVTLQPFARGRGQRPSDDLGVILGPCGAAAAYRRSAWEAAGGFDESLFFYAEDLDLALRMRALGWAAAEAPDARGVHLGGATAGAGSDFQRWHAAFGRGFTLRRYGTFRTRHAARAAIVELLAVVSGLARGRGLQPLRARVAGWRSAAGPRVPLDPAAVDPSLTLCVVLRTLSRGG